MNMKHDILEFLAQHKEIDEEDFRSCFEYWDYAIDEAIRGFEDREYAKYHEYPIRAYLYRIEKERVKGLDKDMYLLEHADSAECSDFGEYDLFDTYGEAHRELQSLENTYTGNREDLLEEIER